MNILIFIPAFLVFIYCLYKLVKDDYIFIRKNISSEQMFDIAFVVTWISLFFSRLFSFILYPTKDINIFLSFFSFKISDFSLLGLVIGGVVGGYLVARYKKLPSGRLYDFLSVAFAISMPIGFFSAMLFFKEYQLFLYFINGVIYSFFAYYFVRYLNPKLIIFLLFFSSLSLVNSLLLQFLNKISFLTIENIVLTLLILISLFFFFKRK